MYRVGKALVVVALAALAAAPLSAAGFGIFEQGAKANGMAGAFTAQADDPSALFFNAGGLGFVTKQEFSLGFTWIRSSKAEFRGANPYPGVGYRADQKTLSEFPPHFYWVRPINNVWKFGFGIETPFGLTTEWNDNFAGRFISTKAALRVFDLNPTLGWQVTPSFGIGVGAIVRYSDLELNQHVGAINPFTLGVADVGKINLKGDFSEGYGWNIGILHKYNNSFSWGLSYRSRVTVDYEGNGRLTQIPTGTPFDQVVAGVLPYGVKLPVKTSIDYPDMASLGLAMALNPTMLLEVDVNWTGWSRFKDLNVDFTGGSGNSLPDATIHERWKDVYNYRAGFRWTTSPSGQWRFGYVYDQTPQPEQSVNPLLPDADRNGFTIGYGFTGAMKVDLSLMYLDFKERSRSVSFADDTSGPFYGKYKTRAWLFGATVTF